MQVQIEFWQLVTGVASAIVSFALVVWAFGTMLVKQFKDGLDARFVAQDEMRKQREKTLDGRFAGLDKAIREEGDGWRQVERDFLQLKIDLPNHYVRRDDWIRFGGSIDSKMDKLHEKVDAIKDSVHARN